MKINVSNLGKRYNREWIFRNLTREFSQGFSYAITGPNGSGKSTLLQVLAGAVTISEGTLTYSLNDKPVADADIYQHISIAAPYIDPIEEMTLTEFFHFHTRMKPWIAGVTSKEIIRVCGLDNAAGKQIRYFSSGMKQRVKLAQGIFSDSNVIFLDEPCTNFDEAGIALYHSLISQFKRNRLLFVASNDKVEYEFCTEIIELKKL